MMRNNLTGFLILVCFGIGVSSQVTAQADRKRPYKASLFETKQDIKAFSKRLSAADSDRQRVDAIVDLSALYLQIVGDPRFSRSQILQGDRGRVAIKLQQAKRLIQKSKRKAQAQKAARSDTPELQSASVKLESIDQEIESAVIDKQWLMLSHLVGGTAPSMYYGSGLHGTSGHFYRGRAGGQPGDNGDELLDLIQTIIHPDFWQINGGAGRAYYYQPLRILVVRATQRVHEDMHNLLARLRAQF